jgi:uncharacterized membrane protein YhaH (DUF805 family)
MRELDWFVEPFRKYADFSGRARRKEYWMFTLFNLVVYVLLMLIAGDRASALIVVYALAVILPSFAVSVRRLHDTGRSGWWALVAAVPFVGGLILLVFMIQEGEAGVNRFGPNPKGVEAGSRQQRPA